MTADLMEREAPAVAPTGQLPDGVYFDLPMATYLAQERMSSSGVQNMLVSPANFWAESWMNPERKTREEGEEETKAQKVGTAYHMARLEPERFTATYYCELDAEAIDPPPLTTHTAVKAALKELGAPQTQAGEGVLEAGYRLRELGGPTSLHVLEDELAKANPGKTMLPLKVYREILIDMDRLHSNREVAPLLEGGRPEVTILWTDNANPRKPMRWKCRLDCLTPTHIGEIKTFENSRRRPLDKAIADAIAYNGYYVQAVIEWTGADLMRRGELPFRLGSAEDRDFFDELTMRDEALGFWWIFQEKGGVPNLLARQLRMVRDMDPARQAPDQENADALASRIAAPSQIVRKAEAEIQHAVGIYWTALEIFGDRPWGSLYPRGEIDDDDFSPFWLEGRA